jgi:hypothetical protein
MLGAYANDKPEPVHVEISERGIKLNRDLYIYETIASFWMYKDHNDRDQLVIVTGRKIMPQRIVSLPETVNPLELRKYLITFIEEKETKKNMLDTLAESFGL